MKKNTIVLSLAALIMAIAVLPFCSGTLYADDNYKEKPYMKKIEEMRLKKKSGIFSLDLDVQGGLTIANTKFEYNQTDTSTQSLNTTSSKVGPAAGFTFTVNFLGFGFSTGMLYASKGFQQQNGTNFNLNYFNIPLLFYFGFDVGKVMIDGNLGPYFGLLLSSDNSPIYSVKKFDFGVTGLLQGAYMITDHIGPLLGIKYEYGGLNNLVSNETIKSVRTQTMFIYTGARIMF